MIDIQKEREAFEAIPENIRLLRGAKFQDCKYVALSLFDDSSRECATQLNYGWKIWQASALRAEAKLDGCVVVPKSEYAELNSDKEHFSNACIDWTDRAYKQRAKVEHIKNEVERFKQSGTHLDLSNFLDNLIEFATFKHDDELKDFVLIKLNEKCVYAIEQEVEQQVEASGITADVFRLDGEKILNALLEAARGGNE
ncbi:hypothetical protein QLH32_05695 [Acinetobacter corruptisaponis]|uniref:DUF4303 domain-containing protein n=1 Tax=Acinetobacter corruptisaponis TaxID=3045147 RepID=A0ABY8S952_9GAMM|nr:hypothetical protein [Acinetobacter sp. KCTC 92772]WHP06959.1 hypothetical protein QLH32_05695 [Acinetobacter sp. KCTC 92772]